VFKMGKYSLLLSLLIAGLQFVTSRFVKSELATPLQKYEDSYDKLRDGRQFLPGFGMLYSYGQDDSIPLKRQALLGFVKRVESLRSLPRKSTFQATLLGIETLSLQNAVKKFVKESGGLSNDEQKRTLLALYKFCSLMEFLQDKKGKTWDPGVCEALIESKVFLLHEMSAMTSGMNREEKASFKEQFLVASQYDQSWSVYLQFLKRSMIYRSMEFTTLFREQSEEKLAKFPFYNYLSERICYSLIRTSYSHMKDWKPGVEAPALENLDYRSWAAISRLVGGLFSYHSLMVDGAANLVALSMMPQFLPRIETIYNHHQKLQSLKKDMD